MKSQEKLMGISSGKHRITKTEILFILIGVVIFCGICLCIALYFHNYESIGEEQKKERILYVNEISLQLSASVYFQRAHLLSNISDKAHMLDLVHYLFHSTESDAVMAASLEEFYSDPEKHEQSNDEVNQVIATVGSDMEGHGHYSQVSIKNDRIYIADQSYQTDAKTSALGSRILVSAKLGYLK